MLNQQRTHTYSLYLPTDRNEFYGTIFVKFVLFERLLAIRKLAINVGRLNVCISLKKKKNYNSYIFNLICQKINRIVLYMRCEFKNNPLDRFSFTSIQNYSFS